MLLTLNAYWFPEDYDPDDELLGKKPKEVLGEIVVSSYHICAFHPHSETGETMLRLLSGDVFRVTEKYESFKNIMFDEEVARDILTSGEN